MRRLAMMGVLVAGLALVGAAGSVVAVAPFGDEANTGLANVGTGLGEMLSQRLSAHGVLVVPPGALQAWLAQNGLLPSRETWQAAALALGAEVLILPAVEKFQATTVSFTVFLFTVRGATVVTDLRAELVRGGTGATEVVKAHGEASGPASVEVSLHFPVDVCGGGFRTSKSVYYGGEAVLLGYLDPLPPNSFYVVIHPVSSPTPSWTSAAAGSSVVTPCVSWTWNQVFPPQAEAGDYVAELYQVPNPVPIGARTFSITAAAAVELVVGTSAFGTAPWGEALGGALDELTEKLLLLLGGDG
ncbi:hypothetical protein H5T54_05960 [Candidatus Bipolaricaulota bacterium]|nr:hypothetical protein [Candidatus Bipolaricaulota bacterium]